MSVPPPGLIVLFCLASTLLVSVPGSLSAQPQQRAYYVAPSGDNDNRGTLESPFETIQHALDVAEPGDTIHLAAGDYFEDPRTRRSGTADRPIIITGSRDAVVKGSGDEDRVFQINHGYITLNGFSIDGYVRGKYRDKLIYVLNTRERTPLKGVRILHMRLANAGGECLRLRYYIQEAEIAYNTISSCGQDDFPGGVWRGKGKNGEGIYIGTAPEQQDDGKNPDDSPDLSRNNHIHHNAINTQGNECIDIKEHASNMLVEYNRCTGQKDTESGGLSARGNSNLLRYNLVDSNIGAGIRFGGDDDEDGINNRAYGNTITNNGYGSFKIERRQQGGVCGNFVLGNGSNEGNFGDDYPPDQACSSDIQLPAGFPPAPGDARCFDQTVYCTYGRIGEFWEQNGGLSVFGLPIAPPQVALLENRLLAVQWFERNRLELHPENRRDDPSGRVYDILLGRLGADMLQQRELGAQNLSLHNQPEDCRFFPETGQSVCGAFLEAWRQHGLESDGQPGLSETENLALFGLPISPPRIERLSDGKEYTVQWFERARFELHPENVSPYNVLFGLLGREAWEGV